LPKAFFWEVAKKDFKSRPKYLPKWIAVTRLDN